MGRPLGSKNKTPHTRRKYGHIAIPEEDLAALQQKYAQYCLTHEVVNFMDWIVMQLLPDTEGETHD